MKTKKYTIRNESRAQDRKSFIGGKPILPIDEPIPICSLCSSEQTFFFQVTFPDDHIWRGFSISVFSCTSCVMGEPIPEMLSVPLKGATIPDNMLRDYQTNFKFVVFPTNSGIVTEKYQEKVQFKELVFSPCINGCNPFCTFDSTPNWISDDESPGLYERSKIIFLFQVHMNVEFRITDTAPQQIRPNFGWPLSEMPYYMLFNQNEIYFFGKEKPSNDIYVITQVD